MPKSRCDRSRQSGLTCSPISRLAQRPILCVPCGKKSSSPLRHGCRNPDGAGAKHREGTDAEISRCPVGPTPFGRVANRDLPAPNSQLLTPYQKKLVDLVDLENLAPPKTSTPRLQRRGLRLAQPGVLSAAVLRYNYVESFARAWLGGRVKWSQ
jgi:hypothetical protein